MYIIIGWDCGIPYPINSKGQGDKYSPPKEFKTKKDAERWIEKHIYRGMSVRYEIRKKVLPDET